MRNGIKIYRSGIHLGEEPIVAGNHSSGVVYFSGCHLSCSFCYTPETSVKALGKVYSGEEFLAILEGLVAQGARNLNLISPTHLWAELVRPLALIRTKYFGLLPLVAKVSGFESVALARNIASFTDVLVPDFKFFSPEVAERYNLPANYGQVALSSIEQYMRTHGQFAFNSSGKIQRGIVLRHLLVPGEAVDSHKVIEALGSIGYRGYLNLMTNFVNIRKHQLLRASEETVASLSRQAIALGIPLLVNGRESRLIRSQPKETTYAFS